MDSNDTKALKNIINKVITLQNKPSIRYKNIAFSTKDHKTLDLFVKALREELFDYHFWAENNGPEVPHKPSYRIYFNKIVFEKEHPGLVIVSPEDWMFDWPELEKRSFWSALSEEYGRHIVITVFAENHENINFVSDFFYMIKLNTLPLKLWVSNYQQGYEI